MKKALGIAALAASFASTIALAQPAPIGIAPVTLSDEPYVFDTAEQHGIKVTVLAKDFARPFAIDFLPNGDLLLTERGGALRIIRNATSPDAALDPQPVAGMPNETEEDVFSLGAQDITVHPDFAENGLVYFTYNEFAPVPEGGNPLQRPAFFRLMRAKLTDAGITDVEILFRASEASYAGGSRVAIGGDGMVWVTTGAPFGDDAQDISSPYGKVLRLNEDGSFPADNPFVDAGGHPAAYTMGHRDQHGLVVHPVTGDVFSAEHGPSGGDEANLIKPGANYGWPNSSYGRDYDGTTISDLPLVEGIERPVLVWEPSIAPSGLMFYQGDQFPAWQGNLFIGSARWGEINFTGSLQRAVFNDEYGEIRREALLQGLHQRVRDVVEGPDGNIYILTDGNENAVLRIEPAEL